MGIERDVQRLLDIEEIKQLKARYFRCIDRKLWDDWHTVYAPDAVALGQGFEIRGLETLIAFTKDRVGEATTVHHGHQVEIWFDDDRHARAIWAMQDIVQFDGDGEPQGFRGYGHYEDAYAKLDEGWRITSCELVRHLTHKLPGGFPRHWLAKRPGVYEESARS